MNKILPLTTAFLLIAPITTFGADALQDSTAPTCAAGEILQDDTCASPAAVSVDRQATQRTKRLARRSPRYTAPTARSKQTPLKTVHFQSEGVRASRLLGQSSLIVPNEQKASLLPTTESEGAGRNTWMSPTTGRKYDTAWTKRSMHEPAEKFARRFSKRGQRMIGR